VLILIPFASTFSAITDIEILRFRRGESISSILWTRYLRPSPKGISRCAHDAGPSLDSEQLWFIRSPSRSRGLQEEWLVPLHRISQAIPWH